MLSMKLNNGKTLVVTDDAGAGVRHPHEILLDDYLTEVTSKPNEEEVTEKQ